jgi:predicted nucleic acid-binding protein
MRIGLDTSVLVRLLVGEPREQARTAAEAILVAVDEGAEVTASELVVAEAYFALQSAYRLTKVDALGALGAFFEQSPVRSAAAAVLSTPNLATAKPGFVDRLIAVAYARDHDFVWTFERAARRLPKVRVLSA